jgi:hypothetical protein
MTNCVLHARTTARERQERVRVNVHVSSTECSVWGRAVRRFRLWVEEGVACAGCSRLAPAHTA